MIKNIHSYARRSAGCSLGNVLKVVLNAKCITNISQGLVPVIVYLAAELQLNILWHERFYLDATTNPWTT
jgi:hypothetical protein